MQRIKPFLSVFLALAVLSVQVGFVFAAPPTQGEVVSGTVTGLACETDTNTGITIFVVTLQTSSGTQMLHLDQANALKLGLITVDANGVANCSVEALSKAIGLTVSISADDVLPVEEEPEHPVGSALATFFSGVTDYDTIMAAHESGVGFGVLAQALWMTDKLDGDEDVFLALVTAKQTGDYSVFTLPDGTSPKNWGQLRKAIMNGEEGNLGVVVSNKGNNGNGNGNGNNGNNGSNGNGNGNNGNNGSNGNGNGNNGNNGNGNGNNGNNDDDKGKGKDK